LRKKTLDLKEWFNKQTAALKSNNTSIDEFGPNRSLPQSKN
jgi:hypothetical protein